MKFSSRLQKENGPLFRRAIIFCLGALLLCAAANRVPGQITSNVFRRVLLIKIGDQAGTGFTIEVDERQYLITAKHLTAALKDEDTIHVRKGDEWFALKVTVLRCADPIDIAVLVPPSQLTVTFPLEPTMKGVAFGQEVYFVGFPYGLFTSGENVNGLFPLAFIKHGIMSASRNQGDAAVIFVDGLNNPGFSGGPIVFRDLKQRNVFKVMAVVSGFRHEHTPVLQRQSIRPEDITAEDVARARILNEGGQLFRLIDTGQLVRLNTGIVIGYNISHAVDLIRANPKGPKVTSATAP